MLALFLRTRVRRVIALLAFAVLFVLSGVTARMMAGGEGHVEMGDLFLVGGYPLVSTLLLLGWLLGRYPLIATLALASGIVSEDRVSGMSRLYAVHPTSLTGIYVRRVLAVAAISFLLSVILLPTFDLLMLGTWAGYATLILIIGYIAVYASLCFFLSVWLRHEVWIVLMLAIAAMLWDALLRSGKLSGAAPGLRELVAILLPPQGALFQLESAFGAIQPVPWGSFAYVLAYGAIMMVAGILSLRLKEL